MCVCVCVTLVQSLKGIDDSSVGVLRCDWHRILPFNEGGF